MPTTQRVSESLVFSILREFAENRKVDQVDL